MGVEPAIDAGSPLPQKVVVAGAVKVLVAITAVTVTPLEFESVLLQVMGDTLLALMVNVVEADKAADVNMIGPPVPNTEVPEVLAPLCN